MKRSHLPVANTPWLRLFLLGLTLVLISLLLSSCGFRLKGTTPLPFDTLYTNISANTSFGASLRRALLATSPNLRFVADPKEADARLEQLGLSQSRREVSLNPEGQVEEYELRMTFRFELLNQKGQRVLPPTTLVRLREIPYESSAFQAKQGEISQLFVDMQQSIVDQMVRRLTSAAVQEKYQELKHSPDSTWPDDFADDEEAIPDQLYDDDYFESPLLNFP